MCGYLERQSNALHRHASGRWTDVAGHRHRVEQEWFDGGYIGGHGRSRVGRAGRSSSSTTTTTAAAAAAAAAPAAAPAPAAATATGVRRADR
jgi:hypothetical protein